MSRSTAISRRNAKLTKAMLRGEAPKRVAVSSRRRVSGVSAPAPAFGVTR